MDNGARSYRRFLEGDKNAIGEMIAEYKNGLILYLSSFFRDMGTAEEIAEETFVTIAIKKPRFSGKSSFKTFLYAVGRYTALGYIRKNKNFYYVPLTECAEFPDNSDIEYELLRSERDLILHSAIQSLSLDYRQVLMLAFFEDMSNEEIGRVMKKSRKQVENLIYNAKKSLRSKLERSGIDHDEF